MHKFPEIETDRLVLRKIISNDIPKIIEYAGNIKIAEMTLNIPHPYAKKDAIFWLNSVSEGFKNQTQYTFGIGLNTPNEFIGGIGLKIDSKVNQAELGYWIAEPFWNKGYATEAVEAVLKFGFTQLNLDKIHANHFAKNPSSGKVMLKNGMLKQGELPQQAKKGNEYKSLIQYSLTHIEFKN